MFTSSSKYYFKLVKLQLHINIALYLAKTLYNQFNVTIQCDKMINEEIKIYNELNDEQKQIIDDFRTMKLNWDHARFSLYKFRIEDILSDYQKMLEFRAGIQLKYHDIIHDLNEDELIEGELDAHKWSTHREQEDLVWTAEMQLLDDVKGNFEMAIKMIESGEAEKSIIEAENW